jgi:hypothetical protein
MGAIFFNSLGDIFCWNRVVDLVWDGKLQHVAEKEVKRGLCAYNLNALINGKLLHI